MTKHKRIKNRAMICAIRKHYCEHCGHWCNIEPHHIFSVGSGGGDIAENLIQLCTECHIGVHCGVIKREKLISVVAEREEKTPDEIYIINRRAMNWGY